MIRIDGYLSQKAQTIFPGSLVIVRSSTATEAESWMLDRPNRPMLGLGNCYGRALQAIQALLKSERHRLASATPDGSGPPVESPS